MNIGLASIVSFVESDKSIVYTSCTMIRETALPDQFLHQYTINFNSLDPVDTCALSNGESVYLPNPTYATSVQRYDRFIRYREDTYMWMVKVRSRKRLEW